MSYYPKSERIQCGQNNTRSTILFPCGTTIISFLKTWGLRENRNRLCHLQALKDVRREARWQNPAADLPFTAAPSRWKSPNRNSFTKTEGLLFLPAPCSSLLSSACSFLLHMDLASVDLNFDLSLTTLILCKAGRI